MRFSRAITGHADLDAETARRLYAAMSKAAADFSAQLQRLAGMTSAAQEPKALLASATAAGLRDTALAIVAAWYTGTVASNAGTTVVSYVQALMYLPVRDAQSAPTYCLAGPAWWTRDPPAIRVAPPVEKAAPKAPTTGFPVPVSGAPAAPSTAPQPSASSKAPVQSAPASSTPQSR